MCDGFGISPYTFSLLMCAALFIIRPSTAVRILSASFWSDAAPRHFYSMSGYIQRVTSPTTIHFTPALSQGLLLQDRDALSIHKGYCGSHASPGVSRPEVALIKVNISVLTV